MSAVYAFLSLILVLGRAHGKKLVFGGQIAFSLHSLV